MIKIKEQKARSDRGRKRQRTGPRVRYPGETEYAREYARKHGRKYRLRYKYGITPEDYERMYAEQQGCCKICRSRHAKLLIDHNHETGEVRGLLCQRCNVALGWLGDRQDLAVEAARYLAGPAA